MVELGFLFWLFLAGIIVASCQDLKRREVDNWLNNLLFVSGLVFVLYQVLFENNLSLLVQLGFAILIMGVAMNLFYYGRVFAGGDAKLMFAMSAFFIGSSFNSTLINSGLFLFFLMIGGSVYGLTYSLVLYFRDFKKANKEIKKTFFEMKFVRIIFYVGVVLILISIFGFLFAGKVLPLMVSGIIILFPILLIFSKSLEKVSMVKTVRGKDLREGDWLAHDVKIGNKIIKADWEGLTEKTLKLLRKKKSVVIKEGIPFVPAFLIAFLIYEFGRDLFFRLLGI